MLLKELWTWDLTIREVDHLITLDNRNGEAMLYVDGQPIGRINEGKHAWENYDYRFMVDKTECYIFHRAGLARIWKRKDPDLIIDGFFFRPYEREQVPQYNPVPKHDIWGLLILILTFAQAAVAILAGIITQMWIFWGLALVILFFNIVINKTLYKMPITPRSVKRANLKFTRFVIHLCMTVLHLYCSHWVKITIQYLIQYLSEK